MREVLASILEFLLPWLIFMIVATTISSALVVVLVLLTRRRRIGGLTDAEMTVHHFVIRQSKKAGELHFLIVLLGGVFGIFSLLAGMEDEFWLFSFVTVVVFLGTLLNAVHTLRAAFFKCAVQGGEFRYRAFLRERTFTIHSIRRVGVRHFAHIKGPSHIDLYAEDGRLATIRPHLVDHTGYALLVELLRGRRIPGSETLPEEVVPVQQYAVETRGMDFRGRVFFILQVTLVLLALAPFFWAETMAEPLREARTAEEILRAYLVWYQAFFRGTVAAVSIILLGNLILILLLKRMRGFGKIHAWTAVVTIVVILGFNGAFHVVENPQSLMRDSLEDLVAIETEAVVTQEAHLDLNDLAHFISRLPSPGGEPHSAFRQNLQDMDGNSFTVYLPREFPPHHLRNVLEGAEYQSPDLPEGIRRIEISYTPNFRLVTEIIIFRA